MFQLSIKEDKEDDDDTINKTVGINSSKSFVSNTCSTQKLTTVSTIPFNLLNYATFSRNHSEFILNGLKSLKSSRILCDITLIAENKRFDVHKVLMASCSDYFRSMFTNGMKECQQTEIELKGVSALGLEKVIEIIYTSNTQFDSNEALFECIAAANHMQCLLAVDVCEKNFVSRVTCHNFNYFIQMAKLYRLRNALKQIDAFILNNLTDIILNMNTLTKQQKRFQQNEQLTYEQLVKCLFTNELKIKEIDLFYLTWRWFVNTSNQKSKSSVKIIRSLMKQIRFALISPQDLVNKVQRVNRLMLNDKYLQKLVFNALNHHLVPNNCCFSRSLAAKCRKISKNSSRNDLGSNSLLKENELVEDENQLNTEMRSTISSVMLIGGREISPTPNLHDKCYLLNNYFNETALDVSAEDSIQLLTALPNNLSHMQCVVVASNYLYVIGGCVSQCAHGESAVSTVYKYDPRFNSWSMVKSMQEKRSYFYACAVVSNHSSSNEKRKINFENNRLKECLYAIGGRNRDGSLRSMERYEPCTDTWTAAPMLPSALYAHSGCSLDSVVYVSGGYGGSAPHNQFTSDLYAYEPSATEWTQLRPMNAARGWHCMCTVKDKLYVFGGCILLAAPPALNSSANQPQPQIAHPVQTTEYYSIETNQWTIVKPMMNFHKEANCLQLNNFVYILGGYNIQTKTGQKIISRYDYSKDIWHTYGQHLPAGMTGMGCCLIQLPWFLLNSNDQPIAYASSESSVSLSKGLEINDQDDDDETDEDSYYDGDEESDNDDNNEQEAVNTQSIQSDKKNSIKKGLDSRNDLIKSLSLTPTTNTTI